MLKTIQVTNNTKQILCVKEGVECTGCTMPHIMFYIKLKRLQPNESFQMQIVDTDMDLYRLHCEYWFDMKDGDRNGGVFLDYCKLKNMKEVTFIEKVNGATTSYSYTALNRKSPKKTTKHGERLEESTKHRWTLPWLLSFFKNQVIPQI